MCNLLCVHIEHWGFIFHLYLPLGLGITCMKCMYKTDRETQTSWYDQTKPFIRSSSNHHLIKMIFITVCTAPDPSTECLDVADYCAELALDGECKADPEWMKDYCCYSCSIVPEGKYIKK